MALRGIGAKIRRRCVYGCTQGIAGTAHGGRKCRAMQFALGAGSAGAVLYSTRATMLEGKKDVSMQAPEGMLDGKRDAYGGIIVNADCLPEDAASFNEMLGKSIELWQLEQKRGVWLKIPSTKSNLISVAVSHEFEYHHAEREYLMLTRWLPTDVKSPLPPNASHQVGVGAFILNKDGKILLVQEAVGPAAKGGLWKIPTGLVNAGEDIKDAAIRETLEETGIDAKFHSIVAFRHAHGMMAGKSDLFFVCLMTAESESAFQLQAAEIKEAKWDSIDSFLNQTPYPKNTAVWNRLYTMAKDVAEGKKKPVAMEHLDSGWRGNNYVYFAAEN